MTLEDLVAPLWFAKKLPKDMDTVFVYRSNCQDCCGHDCTNVSLQQARDLVKKYHYAPAPTMQEMLPILMETGKKGLELINQEYSEEFQLKWNQAYLKEAFKLELVEKGRGWQYLDNLLFEK